MLVRSPGPLVFRLRFATPIFAASLPQFCRSILLRWGSSMISSEPALLFCDFCLLVALV